MHLIFFIFVYGITYRNNINKKIEGAGEGSITFSTFLLYFFFKKISILAFSPAVFNEYLQQHLITFKTCLMYFEIYSTHIYYIDLFWKVIHTHHHVNNLFLRCIIVRLLLLGKYVKLLFLYLGFIACVVILL